jgi:cell division protease FtsH
VGLPDVRGREGILRVHTRKIPVGPDVDLEIIAKGTPGFSGADLANLVNEAALFAARHDKKAVAHADFDYARDKIVMGAERRSLLISDKEKQITAYHEAGHALTSTLVEHAMPLHKVTIIPHAMALGVTQYLPKDDRHTATRKELQAQLAVAMGGRAAEHVVFGEYTTGAADDIKRATETARRMVSQWGMSERIGPLGFADPDHEVFLGRDISRPSQYSEQTAQEIDVEVRRIIQEAWETAVRVLTGNRDALDRVALSLLERETLNAAEFQMRVDGKDLPALPRAPQAGEIPPTPVSSGTEGGGTAIPVAEIPEPSAVRQPQLRPLGDAREG